MGGAETLGGIARGVGSDAFAAEATSTGRSRAFDHPKPRANPAGGGPGSLSLPPRTHGHSKPRKVNREKKNVESRPWTLRAGDDARGSSTVTAVVCAHLNEPE